MWILILMGLNFLLLPHAEAQGIRASSNPAAKQKDTGKMPQRCFRGTGIVRKVDPENKIVTIFHDAVPVLGWPSMTMPFLVKDNDLLGRFRVGEKVDFEFVTDEKNSLITAVLHQ